MKAKRQLARDVSASVVGGLPILLVLTVFFSTHLQACSLAPQPGYFHQVTSIRGQVVGKSLGPMQFRWLRQSFHVSDATLTLYAYPWSVRAREKKLIAEVKTNTSGAFDFGAVDEGHYSLEVSVKDSESLGGWFPVEVTNKVGRTQEIVLDVSPIHPDCSGGQEFIERK